MIIRSSQDIGQCIRRERKAQGLTQADLAGISGVGRRFIIDIEHGKETSSIGKIIHVMMILGLEIEAR